MERTFIIVKPDAMQRGLAGEIIKRFEQRGLRIVGLKLMLAGRELAETHYGEHREKGFFPGLVNFITSSPVIVAVLEGVNAIEAVGGTVGLTNPAKSPPGSIRADYGVDLGRNLVHRSDGAESAAREIGLWFKPEELLAWRRSTDEWIFEPQQ